MTEGLQLAIKKANPAESGNDLDEKRVAIDRHIHYCNSELSVPSILNLKL